MRPALSSIPMDGIAERGTMFDPGPCVSMETLVVAHDAVDLDASIEANLAPIARATGCRSSDLTVAILDRAINRRRRLTRPNRTVA